MEAGETSYNSVKGEIEDSQTPLTPFYSSQDIFWNSDIARDPTIFGYTYADTDPTSAPGEDIQGVLIKKIRDWYGGSSAIALRENHGVLGMPPHQAEGPRGNPQGLKNTIPNVRFNAGNPSI